MSRALIASCALATLCLAGGCTPHPTRPAPDATDALGARVSVSAASSAAPSHSAETTAAAVAAAEALFAANTATDTGFDATWSRHPGLLTPGFAEQLHHATAGGSDASWRTWQAHRATLAVTARLVLDDAPADTPTVAARRIEVTVTPRGASGWVGAPTRYGVVLTLLRLGNRGWLVAGIHVDD